MSQQRKKRQAESLRSRSRQAKQPKGLTERPSIEARLRYVYVGNVPSHPREHTYCPECNSIAIKRYGFDITGWNLDENNRCASCSYQLPIVGGLSSADSEDRKSVV